MADERIASGWTVEFKRDTPQAGEGPRTLFFELNIDDRGVVKGKVFRVDAAGGPGTEPFSEVTGRRQPGDDDKGSLMSLSFNSGNFNVFLSGFTFKDSFTRFEGRYLVRPRQGAAPAETAAGSAAAGTNTTAAEDEDPPIVADGPGETGTGTGQQT